MLQKDETVLVIVDVQGKLARMLHDSAQTIKNIGIMVQACQVLGMPMLWAEQVPEKLGSTVPEIAELLTDQQPIRKSSFSCCGNAEFNAELARTGRDHILLTGIETHVCVYQTAIDLLAAGKKVHLIVDAMDSRAAQNKHIGLQKMTSAGAALTSVEMCLFELLNTAEAAGFRSISQLLK